MKLWDDWYYLVNKKPVKCENMSDLSRFSTEDRTVCKTKIGKVEVSTVFLGLDHRIFDGPPLLFETMIFPECDYMERYSTWDEAAEGHWKAVNELKEKMN